jgi:hypothetical protein
MDWGILAVSVEQRDIDEGDRCSCQSCPIARAAMRALPKALRPYGVQVSQDRIEVCAYHPEFRVIARWDLPESAQAFIEAFDGPDEVEPKPKVEVFPFSFVAKERAV